MSQFKSADRNTKLYQKDYQDVIDEIDRQVLLIYGKSTNINQNKAAIDKIIRDSGYNTLTANYVNEGYQEIYKSSFDMYKRETGETWNFSDESLDKLTNQKQIDVDEFGVYSNKYLNEATRIITQGATNNISTSIISADLLKIASTFKNSTNTWVDTSYSAMMRSSNVLMAEDNGVKKFKYAGPGKEAPNIRPFCKKHVGQVKTIKEWDALDNGAGQLKPVSVYLGSYNCRHLLTGVID